MYKIGEEEMIICPYNRYHVVSKSRIQKHIFKCKQNNPSVKLVTCFYNYSHRLKPEDMLAHYEICSHKTRVEGARYFEGNNASSRKSSVNSSYQLNNFPDINAKPKFFSKPSSSTQGYEISEKLNRSSSESDHSEIEVAENKALRFHFFHNNFDDDDDDLEPLPLPKTASKAFVCTGQFSSEFYAKILPETSQSKGFGRGKNLMECSSPKSSRTIDDLLSDPNGEKNGILKNENSSNSFLKNKICGYNESIVSSMLDDVATLKSEDIIFEDEIIEDNVNLF